MGKGGRSIVIDNPLAPADQQAVRRVKIVQPVPEQVGRGSVKHGSLQNYLY